MEAGAVVEAISNPGVQAGMLQVINSMVEQVALSLVRDRDPALAGAEISQCSTSVMEEVTGPWCIGEDVVDVTTFGMVEEEHRLRARSSGIELLRIKSEMEGATEGLYLEGLCQLALLVSVKGLW
jgi:hypothetical protein